MFNGVNYLYISHYYANPGIYTMKLLIDICMLGAIPNRSTSNNVRTTNLSTI